MVFVTPGRSAVLMATPERFDKAAFGKAGMVKPEAARVQVEQVTACSITSAAQFVALLGSTKTTASCPCCKTRLDDPVPPPATIVHVVGVIVTVVDDPVVAFTTLNVQFGTAKVVAVGKVTATDTEPMYSTRPGLQSVDAMVSVDVLPVMALPPIPGRVNVGGLLTPPLGREVILWGTPFGEVGGVILVNNPLVEM